MQGKESEFRKGIAKNYTYTDNFGKKRKIRASSGEIKCVPYVTVDTGIRALRIQNLCKLMFWETYKDIKLCSKSIICKYDESLLHKSLSKDDIYKLAIPEKKLKELINEFAEQ